MNFIQRHRRPVYATFAAAVIAATVALTPQVARADVAGTIANWLSGLGYYLIQFLGNFLSVVINILVAVAQYNDFLAAPAVVKGWVIVRDVANMFFIVVLLIIAFGTILRLENYRYNRLLARLIIMAVLVNFSKFIAGFFIDFSQVVMLTFVNAWRDVAASNIVNALGLEYVVTISEAGGDLSGIQTNEGAILTAILLGLFLVGVAVIVISIIAIVLILRILALWFLVVLSPLAYLFRTYPSTEKYAARWWSEFGKYVVTGPVVAFLLWLSLAIMAQPGQLSDTVLLRDTTSSAVQNIGSQSGTAAAISAAITDIGRSDKLLSYTMGIMLLVGTLIITKELGVAGGQLAGRAAEGIRGFATKAAVVGGAGLAFGGVGAAAAIGGKKAVQLAATGIKAGAGFGGRKLDEWSVLAQQGKGPLSGLVSRTGFGRTRIGQYLAHRPVSLRPSMIKKAYQDYRHRREEGIYDTVAPAMTDTLNRAMSGGIWGKPPKNRSNLEEIAHNSSVSKARTELIAGGARKEQILSQLLGAIEFKRDANGKVTDATPVTGREEFVEAGLLALGPQHDFNEIVKDTDLGQLIESLYSERERAADPALAHRYGPDAMQRLLRRLFGEHRGSAVGLKMADIGLANTDSLLYGMAEVNEHGEPIGVSAERHAREEYNLDYQALPNYRPEDDPSGQGRTWDQLYDDPKIDDEWRRQFADQIRDEVATKRAEINKAHVLKRTTRVLAQTDRRQDNSSELALGNGRSIMLYPETIEEQYSMLYKQPQLRDFNYENPETKENYWQTHAIRLAYTDLGSADERIRERGKQTYKAMGVPLPKFRPNEEHRQGIMRFIINSMGGKFEDFDKFMEADNATSDAASNQIAAALREYHGNFDLFKSRFDTKVRERLPEFWAPGVTPKQTDEMLSQITNEVLRELQASGIQISERPQIGVPSAIKLDSSKVNVDAIEPIVQNLDVLERLNAGTTRGSAAPGGAPLMDVQAQAYERTKRKAEDYEARLGAGAFFQSPEYLDNPDDYLDEETFEQARDLEKAPISPIGGIAAFSRRDNPSNTLAFDARTFAGGKFGDRAGHYLTDPGDIKEFAQEYMQLLNQEYGQLEAKVGKTQGDEIRMRNLQAAKARLEEAVADPGALANLKIVNTARVGYSARHVAAHEDTHAKLDAMDPGREFRNSLLQGMDPADRSDLVQAIRDKMGNQQMSEEEAFDEYLTEGIVNSWKSWADASPDAITLDPSLMDAIQTQSEKAGQKRFLTSKDIPELEGYEKSSGRLQNVLGGLGYKTASTSMDVLRWSGRTAGSAAKGMGAMAAVGARWTGKQMAKGIKSVFGTTIGQAINSRLAQAAVGTVKAGKVFGGAVASGTGMAVGGVVAGGRGLGRMAKGGAAMTGAMLTVGAQKTRDTLQNFQGFLEKRRRDKVLKLEEDARKRMEDVRVKREQRVQQERSTPRSREYWNQQDQQFEKQISDLNVQRQAAVKAGKVGDVARISQQITAVERQRSLARERQAQGNQYVEDAKREEAAAVAAARKAVAKADAERAKVFGPRLQTPTELKSGLSPEQYSQLEQTVQETTTLQRQYEQAHAETAQKRQVFEDAKDSASPKEYNQLYQDYAAASGRAHNIGRALDAAQDNLERMTKRLSEQFATNPQAGRDADRVALSGLQQARTEFDRLQTELASAQKDLGAKFETMNTARVGSDEAAYQQAEADHRAADENVKALEAAVAAARKNVDAQTARMSQSTYRGPTQERRQVTEEVTEVRESAPAERTERVIEEREAPPSERTERVIEERGAADRPDRSETSTSSTTGATAALNEAIQQLHESLQQNIAQLTQQLSKGQEEGYSRVESAVKMLEQAGSKNADKLRSQFENIRSEAPREGGIIDNDYEKKRTTEFLRELVREMKDHGHPAAGRAPKKGPDGRPI